MLLSLKVKNYALISDVELHFNKGMNIITGETGAGKSILIGALGLSLGKRSDTSALRNKDSKCIIEAVFDMESYNLKGFFVQNDLDYEPQTILRREITTSGKSRAFINDTPVNLKELAAIGAQLIEIHSQRDNLQLFKKEFQFYSLDVLAKTLSKQRNFSLKFNEYKSVEFELNALIEKEAELAKEADFSQFLFDELAAAELEKSNEKELGSEQELLENAEGLIRAFNEADQLFSGSEYAIIEQLQNLKRILGSHNTTITKTLNERLNSSIIELQDIAADIGNAAESVEVNPERLEEVNDKLAALFNLKSKHRVSDVNALIALKDELENKLGETHDLSHKIAKLEAQLLMQKIELDQLADNLHKKRSNEIELIQNNLNDLLIQLGMKHSKLKYELNPSEGLNEYGKESLSLLLSSDKGVLYNDLKKSASGGELARINLSVKSQIAKLNTQQMPSSIFDEIDTGVSGEIARKVGVMMQEMSASQQVIVITHLPQIASLGNKHLFVYKTENENEIQTEVKELHGDERINEIAKMISGDNLTEHAVEQSKELLRN